MFYKSFTMLGLSGKRRCKHSVIDTGHILLYLSRYMAQDILKREFHQ